MLYIYYANDVYMKKIVLSLFHSYYEQYFSN